MRHVPAHWWAELASLSPSKRRAAHKHARDCEACALARDRVAELPAVFAEIRNAEPDDLEWDHVGARIHWARSLERRTGERAALTEVDLEPKRRSRWFAAGAMLAGAGAVAAVAFHVLSSDDSEEPVATEETAEKAPERLVAVELAEGTELEALAVMSQGDVTADGEPIRWDSTIGAGAVLSTADNGKLTVQFDRGGGFTLGPATTVSLRSFDSHSVELVLDGTLDVVVAKREANQQFIIAAGDRTVSVRGTAFRVTHREGDIDVACEHGRVEVADASSRLGVDGGSRLAALGDSGLASAAATALSSAELSELEANLSLPLISAWQGAKETLESTSALSVMAKDDAAVSIDGVRVGTGPMQIRLLAGRHEVAVEGSGPWSRGRWIELDGGADDARIIRAAAPDKTDTTKVRRVQLRLALREHQVELGRCVSRLKAHQVARGAFVELSVRVNADGTLGAVSANQSNLAIDTRRCVLGVVGGLKLPKGPKASARVRWDF